MLSESCSNPNDLPLNVAIVIEENAARSKTPAKCEDTPDSAANLEERLTAIRERLFWLQAVWTTTLSPDVAREADRYRELFRELADELRKQDPESVDRLVAGHEPLLLCDPSPPKPTVPIATQQLIELAFEVRGQRRQSPKPQHDYLPDGLQRFV